MQEENDRVNSFTFYKDYYNLIDTMPIEDKKELAVAILDYVFKDIAPNLNGHNQAIMNTLMRQLDKSKSSSIKGKKGGAPEENNNASKTSQKQTNYEEKNKLKTNQKQAKNKLKTSQTGNQKQANIISNFLFLISNFIFNNNYSNNIKNILEEWLNYKYQRKEKYTEIGFNKLLTQIKNNIDKYGEEKVIKLINDCMASNYKGIIFDKLEEQNNRRNDYKTKWEAQKEAEERFLRGETSE